jgi:hypothetical protein
MLEFALVAPVFLLVTFGTIDYGGYFGDRLAVEEAARAGARVTAVQNQSSFSGTAVVNAILAQQGPAHLPTTDCSWQGSTLDAGQYPPFTFSGSGCMGIWYFDLLASTTGPPSLCIQWSVQHQAFGSYSGGVWTASAPPTGCVATGQDIVVVGVGYQYSPLTPLPAISASALTTYGETQLLEEGSS